MVSSCQMSSPTATKKIEDSSGAKEASPEAPITTTQQPGRAEPKEVRRVSPVIAADMDAEFLAAFVGSKECHGIQVSRTNTKSIADFRVLTSFAKADTPEMEEEWRWTVFDARQDANRGFRAMGNAPSAADAMRDMCMDVWENFHSGGRHE